MWQNNKTDKSNEELNKQDVAASKRITSLFLELLEHQFPTNESKASLQLRSASDFAAQLSVHVNHLNRAIKRTTGKTTSKIIAERILEEAKILLKNSSLNVSEIAYSLGFTKASHFTNFFKKHVDVSPLKFRNIRS
jgi:AraC-like DNA-binding protein